MVKKTGKKNYIDSKELEELIIRYKSCESERVPPRLTNDVYKMFNELCTRVMRSFYFADPDDYDECRSLALIGMFKAIKKFQPWREQKVDGYVIKEDGSYNITVDKVIKGKQVRISYPISKLCLTEEQRLIAENNGNLSGEIVKIKNDCFSYFTTSCYNGIAGAYRSMHPEKNKYDVSLDVIEKYIGMNNIDY